MAANGFIVKLWNWFDNHFLFWAVAFLLAFIPLYPKIPLGELIPGYIVRIRLEDIFIGIFSLWWLIQALRKKVEWRTPLTLAIGLFVGSSLLSNIFAVLITNTLPAELLHIGKSMLHWARYIEYFSLFFLAYAVVKTRKQAWILFAVVIATVLGVIFYGYGQKFHYWPVYSTMNREFSKGMRLYLGPFARVQSTFAGHYDLGAYLVVVLPLLLGLHAYLGRKIQEKLFDTSAQRLAARWGRGIITMAWLGGLWLMAASASRASAIGYLAGAGLLIFLLMLRWKAYLWGVKRGLTILIVSLCIMVLFGDLTTRFAQLIDQNKYPRFHAAYHRVNDIIKNPYQLLGMNKPEQKVPDNALSLDEYEDQLNEVGLTTTDTQPTTSKPSGEKPRPADVLVDIPDVVYELDDPAATLAAGLVEKDGVLVKERIFSECSLERSLSLCIRLETLWPQAIQGFLRNPLFGSGFATLGKETKYHFTEADSTDNNFLRTLGETGALGFFFFYGAVGLYLWYAYQTLRKTNDAFLQALGAGALASGLGLLINTMYIDVFAASKVAYTFWGLAGVMLALFVREAGVAPRYAFEKKQQRQEVSQLSALLAQVEQKAKGNEVSGYVSQKKKAVKSTKKKKKIIKK